MNWNTPLNQHNWLKNVSLSFQMETTNTSLTKSKFTAPGKIKFKCPVFEAIKHLVKNARSKEATGLAIERIEALESEFIIYGDLNGTIFCKRQLAKIYEKAAGISKDLNAKINYLQTAQQNIHEADTLDEQNDTINFLN
jgi:hypothetical protein